jgi:prepilin-type N-terminal cleavage/methylation domain-containing protein
MRAPGYSLVELLAVMALLAVIAGAALPLAAPVREGKLDAATREVANALRFARGEAIRTGGYYGVDFSVDAAVGRRRIRVFRTDTATPPNPVYDVRDPLTKSLYDAQLATGPGTGGAVVSNATFYYKTGLLTVIVRDWAAFDSSGAPVYYPDPSTYSAYSSSPNVSAVTVSLQGQSRQVLLDPVTGRVTTP